MIADILLLTRFCWLIIVVMNKLSIVIVAIIMLVAVWAEQEAEEQAFLSMRRTACLVLSRYYSNTQKETIEGLVAATAPEDQSKFINKLYAVSVEACEPQISQSEVQEFFVENPDFDPTHLFYLMADVNYAEIAKDLKTTKEQDAIIKFMKKFDEDMQIRREEKEAEKQQEDGAEGYEMKFLGISIKDIPSSAKLIYVLIFGAIVGGALWYGFSQVDQKKEKASNKRRKSPKKDDKSA